MSGELGYGVLDLSFCWIFSILEVEADGDFPEFCASNLDFST